MTLFTGISRLHSFVGFKKNDGRRPTASDYATIENSAMLVSRAGTIEWIGALEDWAGYAAKQSPAWRKRVKRVSLRGVEILPAFVECHTHLLYSGHRAEEFERRNRGDSYLEIAAAGGGIRSTVKATSRSKERELEKSVIARLQELTRQGVATVEIKTGYAANIEDEKRHLNLLFKIRRMAMRSTSKLPHIVVTCLAAHSIPDGETEMSWLAKVEALLPFVRKHNGRLDIFIERGAFSLAGARRVLKNAAALGIPLTVHADQLSAGGGTSLGVHVGAQSVDHVIEALEGDIAQLAKSETVAVLLPVADLYTRLSYPKARAMIDAGVRVALATDHNPGTSPALDLALVGVIARTTMRMTGPEVFAAYTWNAARALGVEQNQGILAPGYAADFITLKPHRGLSDLFYEIGPERSHAAVSTVWRSGRRIV